MDLLIKIIIQQIKIILIIIIYFKSIIITFDSVKINHLLIIKHKINFNNLIKINNNQTTKIIQHQIII